MNSPAKECVTVMKDLLTKWKILDKIASLYNKDNDIGFKKVLKKVFGKIMGNSNK